MEQTLSENLQLGQLVANGLSEIERLGYSRRSRNRYRAIWKRLIEFSRRNGVWSQPGNGWRRHLGKHFWVEQHLQPEALADDRHQDINRDGDPDLQVLQIFSTTLLEKMPISCVLEAFDSRSELLDNSSQLILFEF